MQYHKYFFRFWPIYFLTALICVAAAAGGSRAITTLAENTPIPRSNTIIIDAGHGGEDGGATSCTGVLESTINLQLALRLDDLCHLLGMHTVMTRSADISIYTQGQTIAEKKISDLKQRVNIVNRTDNAILISIHQNTFTDSRYSGAQVFYASTDGSKVLADILQSAFIETVNTGSKRASKQAVGIYLLQHITCPGVLIECGFLSNQEEEAKLRDPAYQKMLCCIIASGVRQYINA